MSITFRFSNFLSICTLTFLPSLVFNTGHAENDAFSETFACADATTVMDCIEKTQYINSEQPTEPQNITINTEALGLNGPVSAGVRYDTDLGWIPEISFTQIFYANGIYAQFGYGQNERRANVTLVHGFNLQQQMKITYEYLAQNLPFDFASGQVNEWVSQNAFGAAYRYLFGKQLLRSFDVSGYYIKANNKNLSDIIYYQNNDPRLNLRRIAGGTEETATAAISLAPFRNTLISLGGGYSHLSYDTQYEDNQKNTTIAYDIGIEHLFTRYTKLTTGYIHNAAENDSRVRFSQIFPAHIEAAVTGEYSQGLARQPNSTTITLALSYPVTYYSVPQVESFDALKNWVQKPVVHANRVLAIKDEAVKAFTMSVTNPKPQKVLTGEYITAVNTRDIFNFDPSMYDRIDYSISVNTTDLNKKQDDSSTQLNIALQPDNGSGYYSTIYSTAPIPNSAISNGDPTIYIVTITANGYRKGLIKPIQAVAQLELDVGYNSNNEPQWDKDKIKAGSTINLDVTDIPNSINLNALLQSNQTSNSVKFSLQNPEDPNWAIRSDNTGHYYLVRKAASNNTFDTNFIGNQTANLTVKSADDSDPMPGNPAVLNVKVNPAADVILQWDSSACVINKMIATQPTNTATPQTFNLINSCVRYMKAGTVINFTNDQLSFTASSSYHGGVTINNNQMTVNVALPQDINQNYALTINANSKAAGQSTIKTKTGDTLSILVSHNLEIKGTGENEKQIIGRYGYNYATLYVHQLDKNKSYTITGNPDVSNPDVSLGNANPFVCPGEATSPDTNTDCVQYSMSPAIKSDNNGNATIIWEYSNTDKDQKPSYINKISLQ